MEITQESILFLQKLSSNIIVTHDSLPEDIKVTYTSDCDGGRTPSEKGTCNDVSIGKMVQPFHAALLCNCLLNSFLMLKRYAVYEIDVAYVFKYILQQSVGLSKELFHTKALIWQYPVLNKLHPKNVSNYIHYCIRVVSPLLIIVMTYPLKSWLNEHYLL